MGLKLKINKGAAALLAEDQQDHHRRPDQARQPPGEAMSQVQYPGIPQQPVQDQHDRDDHRYLDHRQGGQ